MKKYLVLVTCGQLEEIVGAATFDEAVAEAIQMEQDRRAEGDDPPLLGEFVRVAVLSEEPKWSSLQSVVNRLNGVEDDAISSGAEEEYVEVLGERIPADTYRQMMGCLAGAPDWIE